MIRFLLWNTNGRPIQSILARLAGFHSVDVLLLLENSVSFPDLLNALNHEEPGRFRISPSLCQRITILARFPAKYISPISEGDRFTIRHLTLPGIDGVLVVAVHFPSKMHFREIDQTMECANLADSIERAEEQVGHSRTIVVGDFNMNPFDDGMVAARGLHAVMSRTITERRTRIVQGQEYRFFYNPMWGLMGDATPGPPGTYYYSQSVHRVFFWNMFDQVLVRPDLLPYFSNDDLKMIESDDEISFVRPDGSPDASVASDHLPLFFALHLQILSPMEVMKWTIFGLRCFNTKTYVHHSPFSTSKLLRSREKQTTYWKLTWKRYVELAHAQISITDLSSEPPY